MIITLTDIHTGKPVQVLVSELGAVKPGTALVNGAALDCTMVFIISDSGCHDYLIEVKETPQEIGKLIIAELTSAGEEIRGG